MGNRGNTSRSGNGHSMFFATESTSVNLRRGREQEDLLLEGECCSRADSAASGYWESVVISNPPEFRELHLR